MELVGDFRSMDPIFKGCYSNSLLYTDVELGRLRWLRIHLLPYQSEIPVPPAPSYLQARQPKVMKWSPPRAATATPSVEFPKAKCSGGKGGPHCSLGCSSNTSTPKCPDSTSAKKPSNSKEPTSNEQEKSLRVHGSHKCGHSPFPSAESVRCKQKEVCTEDTRALNSTLPISSSAFDGLHSPTGSHSDVTELLPPSITLTPLGLGSHGQWQTTSDKSRHSLASIYTSPGFNLPGYPAAGPRLLIPTVPSLMGSHHVSSTWPAGMFTSMPSFPHLTIGQANSLFKLGTECQGLGIKLAKQFQVLSGLEAMNCNSIQGMAHETLTLQIPIDISFQTQIPLTIAYCQESSIYRRWHPEQGGVSPLCKEIRASHTLSKVLGRVTCQPSEGVDRSPSQAPSDHSVRSGGLWGSRC